MGQWVIIYFTFFQSLIFAGHTSLHQYQCPPPSSLSKSSVLIFKGKFKSFETSTSPHILDEFQEEMIQFKCEDLPLLFYVPQNAKTFLSNLSPGDKLKIQGRMGPLQGTDSVVMVDEVVVVE